MSQLGVAFGYGYDALTANITSENRVGGSYAALTTYAYDTLGQLVRVNDPTDTRGGSTGTTWVYNYDRGGNLTSREKFAYTTGALGTRQQLIPYYYNDSNWRDKLTNYNGTAITYDGIGNVVNDGTWYYMWRGGRQLTSAQHGSQVVRYYYNHDGLRVRKTVDNVPTDYTLNGAQITHLKRGSDWMHFWYDGQGRPAIVNYNGTIYHYVYNLQGDVIALLDGSNSIVVEYKYDAWGALLGKTGTLSGTLGELNPFRYRGYIYDEETGLYYLRSRYYNPEWGRFISADALLGKTGALLSHNLFCYCGNNPVIGKDNSGSLSINVLTEMFKLHQAVVREVARAVGTPTLPAFTDRHNARIEKAGPHGGFGYPDVMDSFGHVWEVKPLTLYGLRSGIKQLARYTKTYKPGYPVYIRPFDAEFMGVKGKVVTLNGNFLTGDAGVVYYQFIPLDEWPSYAPEHSWDENEETEYQRAVSPYSRELGWQDIVAGILVAIAFASPIPGDEFALIGAIGFAMG